MLLLLVVLLVSLSVSLLLLFHNVYFCKVRKSSVVNTEQRVPFYFTLTLQNSSCPQNCRPMAVFKASSSWEDQRDIPPRLSHRTHRCWAGCLHSCRPATHRGTCNCLTERRQVGTDGVEVYRGLEGVSWQWK